MGVFLMLAADVRLGLTGDWHIGLNEVAVGLTVPEFALALARHRLGTLDMTAYAATKAHLLGAPGLAILSADIR